MPGIRTQDPAAGEIYVDCTGRHKSSRDISKKSSVHCRKQTLGPAQERALIAVTDLEFGHDQSGGDPVTRNVCHNCTQTVLIRHHVIVVSANKGS